MSAASDQYQAPPPDWDLGDWERVLTIHVGTPYVCRDCGNIAMVTRGGVGVLELKCCGKPMERVEATREKPEGGGA